MFTDGSKVDGGVGAAVVLEGQSRGWSRKAYLGQEGQHTVFEAELVSILLALDLLASHLLSDPAYILLDNQAAIRATREPIARSGQHFTQ